MKTEEEILKEYFKGEIKHSSNKFINYSIINYANDESRYFEIILSSILESNKAAYMYYFAKDLNDKLDKSIIDKLTNAIIKIGSIEYMYYFARDVKGAPIDKLANAIISAKNSYDKAYFICEFAKNIKNYPVDKLADAIIKTGEKNFISCFARDVDGAPIDKLDTALSYLKYEDSKVFKNICEDLNNAKSEKIVHLSPRYKQLLLTKLYERLPNDKTAILFLQVYEEILTENKECSLEECRFLDDFYDQAVYQKLAVKNKNVLEFDNSFTKIHNEIMNDKGLNKSLKKVYMKKNLANK